MLKNEKMIVTLTDGAMFMFDVGSMADDENYYYEVVDGILSVTVHKGDQILPKLIAPMENVVYIKFVGESNDIG